MIDADTAGDSANNHRYAIQRGDCVKRGVQ